MAGGVTFGVRSNGLEADEYVQLPGIGRDRAVPAPPRTASALLSRTLTWSSPSSADTKSIPRPGVTGPFPEPPRNVSEEPPPVSVRLPGPPEAVTSWEPISPTLI
jgi:hypothetical protein